MNQSRLASSERSLTVPRHILDVYAQPAAMTLAGKHARLFDALSSDVGELTGIVQGLAVHEFAATPFYGVRLSDTRRSESHIRSTERMLDRLLAIDAQPLDVARPAEKRLVGTCRHFTLLLVAMLRAKGVPARGRCGFGAYLNPPNFEDHWVCEYWNAAEARWVLVDAQLDEIWQAKLKIDDGVLDLRRDRFLIAGDAWAQCRAGKADAARFGIFKGELRGLWFIAGNLVRDVAALNRMEMLPWDVWGAMPRPHEPLQTDRLSFFDRLAALTRAPDASYAELSALYEGDERLRVPKTVFNAVLQRQDAV
jgi:transglutaminase superfamily protein